MSDFGISTKLIGIVLTGFALGFVSYMLGCFFRFVSRAGSGANVDWN